MNKTKIILAAIGGVILVAVLAASVFAYLSYAAKTAAIEGDDEEGTDGLETVIAKAEKLVKKPIFPCAKSIEALKDAHAEVTAWKDEAFKFAARGDRVITPMTPAQFKSFVISESHRLESLPEGSTNKIIAADFSFGPFKPYIDEGKMPEVEEMAGLQRKFDDAVKILEVLAACGVTQAKSLDVKASAADSEKVEEKPKRGARRQPAKKEVETFKPASVTYVLSMKTGAAAFVKTLNAMAADERFLVVESFTLAPERDAIAAAFGGEKKEEVSSSRRSRGGRRRVAANEEAEEAEENGGAPKVTVVTDPATDASFDAVLTVTVHDFKSLEETHEEEEAK